MKSRASVAFLVMVAACTIDPFPEDPFLPANADVALLHDAAYISHTTSEQVFEVGIVILNSFYVGFDNDYLGSDDFEMTGEEGQYVVESFTATRLEKPQTASAILVVVDQSTGWDENDRYNTRTPALRKFLNDIRAPHTFSTGAAALEGNLTVEPLELFSPQFGRDLEGNTSYLFGLSGRTGGVDAVADAAAQAITLLAGQEGPRRHLVLLGHQNDEDVAAMDELVAAANSASVSVHVIVLGDVNNGLLEPLAYNSGGIFATCSRDKEMVKVLSELERLINREAFVYRMRIRFKSAAKAMNPGSEWRHRLKVIDPIADASYNEVPVRIFIPL